MRKEKCGASDKKRGKEMMGKNEKVCPLKTVFVGLRTKRKSKNPYISRVFGTSNGFLIPF